MNSAHEKNQNAAPIVNYKDDYFHILSEYTTSCLSGESELEVLQYIADTAVSRLGFNNLIIYSLAIMGSLN